MIFKTYLLHILLFCLVCTLIFINCSKNSDKTEDISNFDRVFSELLVIESMSISDSLKAALIIKSLQENNTSIDEIRIHIAKHKENPTHWRDTYSNIKQVLKGKPDKQFLEDE